MSHSDNLRRIGDTEYAFEQELAAVTQDIDRAHTALLRYGRADSFLSVVDLAKFGGWEDWAGMLYGAYGHRG